MHVATSLGTPRRANTSPHRGTKSSAGTYGFYQARLIFLINIQKPAARRAQLFHTHLLDHISLGLAGTLDLGSDYSPCPQQLSKCSLRFRASWKNKEEISSRCCSFAGALTREQDALHKQTSPRIAAAPEHLECTSGWVHIWQHLLFPPSPPLLPKREPQIRNSTRTETERITQSGQDRPSSTLPLAQRVRS